MLARFPYTARRCRLVLRLAPLLVVFIAASASAATGGNAKAPKRDNAPPSVAISSPAPGATVSGTVSVAGSASDNVQVANVQVSVDGGAYQLAAGTTSWGFSLNTAAFADGAHTIAAKATDSSGKTATSSESVTFNNAPPAPPPPPPPPPPPSPDTTPPSVSISAPGAGSTISGVASVAGSASDNAALAKVDVSVDGGTYQLAQGTSSWSYSLSTTALADGTHTLVARATDASGNFSVASESVSVQNSSSLPPGVSEQLVTPEGATIQIYSDVKGWTAQQIYDLLKANALELGRIGPRLTVKVQTTYSSSNSVSASRTNGVYGNFRATIYLKAVDGTVFPARPDDVMAHEYGCVWALYHFYISQQGNWDPWLSARGILGDPRVDSTFSWSKTEMIADDYRMLFGTPAAQSEAAYVNPDVPDPRAVTGLRDFFLNVWAVP